VAALLGDQQGLDGELVEGAGEVEALAEAAAQALQLGRLGRVLDALGDDLEVEEVGDAQDGVGEGGLLGPAQRRLEVEALHGPGVHGGVEHPDPGPAGRLGRVHGHVGVAQQPFGVLVVAPGQPHPDAGPGQDLAAGHGHRGAQDGGQPLAPGHRLGLVGDLGEEHGELVPAEPGRRCRRAPGSPAAARPPPAGPRRRRSGRGCR